MRKDNQTFRATERAVCEEELHAYIDGALPMSRRSAVETYLALHPDEAERIDCYRRQKLFLHKSFDAPIEAPLSAPLEELRMRLVRASQASAPLKRNGRRAAMAACMAVLVAAGWLAFGSMQPTPAEKDRAAGFTRLSVQSHALLGGASPVSLIDRTAAEPANPLVGWLPTRQKRTIQPAPDLRALGFELSGGRIILDDGRPVVQLVYGNKQQQDVSLFLGALPNGEDRTAFTFSEDGDIALFYWRRQQLEFSLVARAGRDELFTLAKAVNGQLQAGSGKGNASFESVPPPDGKVGRPLRDELTSTLPPQPASAVTARAASGTAIPLDGPGTPPRPQPLDRRAK